MIKVNIPNALNIYIENLFYDIQGLKNLINFLIENNEQFGERYISNYKKEYLDKNLELEKIKRLVSKFFCPIELQNQPYGYEFDFDNSILIFTEVNNVNT